MTPQEWALRNIIPIASLILVLLCIYLAVGKIDSLIATRNSELRGQIQSDIKEAQDSIKESVAAAEKHIKEAKEAEGKTDTNANSGKGKADAAAKKKMTDMVSDWNGG